MSSTQPNFTKLNGTNYATWSGEMQAWLQSQGVWRIVSGSKTKPDPSEAEALEEWLDKADKASGHLYLMVEPDQRIHFKGITSDPVKMWKALQDVHLQKKPGNRFNAYDDLFSIRKKEDETLQNLMNRVNDAMERIKDLRPASGFDLDKLDEELASMALIRALPQEYNTFASSLLLLDKLDKDSIFSAFITEDLQRRRNASEAPAIGTAFAATPSTAAKAELFCDFCEYTNHVINDCHAFKRYKKEHKAKKEKGKNKANKADSEAANQSVTEFAGNASALSADDSPDSHADNDWNADTGATSHMTPHRHWIRNYTPLRIPIKLADQSIIYSAGVGTVVFHPVVNGRKSRSVEISRVLHVPKLRSNLLSVLYLTKHKQFKVVIDYDCMEFIRSGTTLFTASINSSNAAFLDGETEPVSELANLASTLPLDLNLWHRRLAHHNYADVKKMIKEEMVTGLVLKSKQQPDPICEPCLAGKMHSNPFPSSPSKATKPLELIHSDLHGPLRTPTPEGYQYWVTFIDDCTSFWAVILLKNKSDTFQAFKTFKAWAENQLEAKIKELQDDKAGEYMSDEFNKFCDDCGIFRRHTTRNRPQQNGVAERANRTISDDVTAMLTEGHMPPSFWGRFFFLFF